MWKRGQWGGEADVEDASLGRKGRGRAVRDGLWEGLWEAVAEKDIYRNVRGQGKGSLESVLAVTVNDQ